MTLPLNSRLSALYDTNGTQKDFSFGFRVFFDPDNGGYGLEVRRQTVDGYEVIPKSDYLVLPVEDNSAGVVRFNVAPSAGQQIYIAGKTPTIQQLVLTNFGRYSAESIETQFDFITAIIQEWLSALGEETRQRIVGDQLSRGYVDSAFENWKAWAIENVPLFAEGYISDLFLELKQEWIDAINHITSGEVPALAIPTSSGQNQQQVNDSVGAKWYGKPFGYSLHDRVMLENGDVVKSTVEGNTNNPNIDMTGWVPSTDKTLDSLNDLLNYKKNSEGEIVSIKSYFTGKYVGGGDFVLIHSPADISNGVTIFKSLAVGYDNSYWKRINYSKLTVEMAGALPDPTFNSREAFHRCTLLGGAYAMQGEYWAEHPQDVSATRVIPYYDKPITFYSENRDATLYCTHSFPTASPYAFGIADWNLRCPLFVLRGVKAQGHKTAGHLPKNERTWAVEVRGCDAYWMSENTFSTFNGFNLYIARQAYQTWFTTDPNTSEAVLALNALNSKNGMVEDNHFEHCGTAACGVFGASHLRFRRNTVDIAGSLYPFLIMVDDASSQTALADYCTNDNVFVENCVAPDATIRVDGVVSGYVKDCTANHITYRTYDFDQQKNNFNSTAHTYNPDDHLDSPFMWMRYLRRNFEISGNSINKLVIRGAFVYHHDNHYTSTADGETLIDIARNSVLWGTGVTHYDDIDSAGNINHMESHDNTFLLNHQNCYCVNFDTTFSFWYYSVLDSKIHKLNDSIAFTHMRYPQAMMRKDSYTVIGNPTSSKTINHPVNFNSRLLTQGVGKNYIKAFNSYRGGQGVQQMIAFKNPNYDVVLDMTIVVSSGNSYRKKAVVTSAGVLTVTNLDGQTAWDTGVFSVTTSGDTKSLNVTVASLDLCIDFVGVGRYGDAVFVESTTRSESTG